MHVRDATYRCTSDLSIPGRALYRRNRSYRLSTCLNPATGAVTVEDLARGVTITPAQLAGHFAEA
jgi:hypothetical protein